MIKHNLTLIYRNALRAKSFFLINLFGLAVGMACTLLIYLWVRDEINKDKFNENDHRLFQVMSNQQYDEIVTFPNTQGLLAETLEAEIPEIESATATTWVNSFTLSIDDHSVKADGFYVSSNYFKTMSYPLVAGQKEQVLTDQNSIVISRELAIKLFSTEKDVIGKTLEWQHEKSFQVTGIFDKVPSSSLQFDFVLSYEQFKLDNKWILDWGNSGPYTYVTLREGSSVEEVNVKIKDFVKGRPGDDEKSTNTFFLRPFSDSYLYSRYENGKIAGGRIEYVRLFSIIAVFILLIACINFMNLSTARASRKAKEVGIKKSIGAIRQSLVIQYLSESLVTALVALLIAALAVWTLLPSFNLITSKHILFLLSDYELLFWMIGIALFTGLLAGSYPAIFLSGFKPTDVLKGVMKGSWSELWARKGLVVFQFFLSVVLIVSVLVIYKQIEFVQTKNLGYNKDNLIRMPIEGKVASSLDAFLNEVKRIPGVVNASSLAHTLTGTRNSTNGLTWEGNEEEKILFEYMRVNYDVIETLGVELTDGRSFSKDFPTDTAAIIFNEAAINAMGLQDPLGKVIKLWDKRESKIIGIVKDFHFQSLHDAVTPLFIILRPDDTRNVMIRLAEGKEENTLKSLGEFYSSFNPGFTFDYQFQDVQYARLYAAEQRVAFLSGCFAVIAILISCLGLFGLANFTAERRLKEIGIRKTLGSSSKSIVLLLTGDFTRMVLLSIVLGLPFSYWAVTQWLAQFAFHIELSIWYFLIAGAIAMLIAWLTVASQAIRAAHVNPVNCFRTE